MYFHVFIDPEAISEAVENGGESVGALHDLLEGFQKDCLMAETDSWRVDTELGEKVRAIVCQKDRKLFQELFIRIRKHGPKPILEGDDQSLPLAEFAVQKSSDSSLDFILSANASEASCCSADAGGYRHTTFAKHRRSPNSTVSVEKGAMQFQELLDTHLLKILGCADEIEITDYAFGKYLSGDQFTNFENWIRWCRDNCPHLQSFIIITEENETNTASLESKRSDLAEEVDFQIETRTMPPGSLEHRRLLRVAQRKMDLDHGIDLCDQHGVSRKNTFSRL